MSGSAFPLFLFPVHRFLPAPFFRLHRDGVIGRQHLRLVMFVFVSAGHGTGHPERQGMPAVPLREFPQGLIPVRTQEKFPLDGRRQIEQAAEVPCAPPPQRP